MQADFPRRYRVLLYNCCENESTAMRRQGGFLNYFASCRTEQCVAPPGLGFFLRFPSPYGLGYLMSRLRRLCFAAFARYSTSFQAVPVPNMLLAAGRLVETMR